MAQTEVSEMGSFSNSGAPRVDLTEQSLFDLCVRIAKTAPGKIRKNYCCVVRFDIWGPYSPVHQPNRPYIHTIYPIDTHLQCITVLMTEWPPGTWKL